MDEKTLTLRLTERDRVMGGIFGASSRSREDVVVDVLTGLLRLTHRGNDCAGIAAVTHEGLKVLKDGGEVEEVSKRLGFPSVKAHVCLGHVRFSTHGRPHHDNAHPHTDCSGSVAVVGDGVIANYEDLKDEEVVAGHYFRSRCDFEVAAHLIEDGIKAGRDFIKAFAEAYARLDGLFTLSAINAEGMILTASKLQAFYVARSPDGGTAYVSSTKSALKGMAGDAWRVPEGVIAVIDGEEVKFLNAATLSLVDLQPEAINVPDDLILKDGYPHFMLKEIYEGPDAVLKAWMALQHRYRSLAARLVANAKEVYVIANGSSLHAGLVGSYYLTELAGVSPIVLSAAEFPLYHVDNVTPGTLVIAVSQSGETGDVLRAVYEAKMRGATILAITNNVDSRLAKLSSIYLPIAAGPEISIPATKTFVATLTTLYVLALDTGEYGGKLSKAEVSERLSALKELALKLREYVPKVDALAREVAGEIASRARSGYVISRGINYPLALEGALKFKEAAYFHAEGMEAGEFRHGPITLVDPGFLTVFIIPAEQSAAKATHPLIADAYGRGAEVVVIASNGEASLVEVPVSKLTTPDVPRHLTPIAYAIPLQLLAYHLGVRRGCPIDTPKKLVKAVTEAS